MSKDKIETIIGEHKDDKLKEEYKTQLMDGSNFVNKDCVHKEDNRIQMTGDKSESSSSKRKYCHCNDTKRKHKKLFLLTPGVKM